ncbi:aromatic prenyltransferase [Streptomyces sp. NPDC057702]|uniref:aromatic prenyltransferase n=1 Tax=unclassified Streptomyces TaxID=2593676 RepID=UPI0036AF4FF5
MSLPAAPPFSDERFVADIRTTAALVEAPFSERTTRIAVGAYADRFATSTVLWKTTERPRDGLFYRFYAPFHRDTIGPAQTAGLLRASAASGKLLRDWSERAGERAVTHCDFHAWHGLAKTYVFFPSLETGAALASPRVPEAVSRNSAAFRAAGLPYVFGVAVNHLHDALNVYFHNGGPLTRRQCAGLAALVGADGTAHPAGEPDQGPAPAYDACAAATVGLDDGAVHRVAFYTTGLPSCAFPGLPERVARLSAHAPSEAANVTHVLARSLAPGGRAHLKVEKSYRGDFAAFIRGLG